jgi:hypothetical protein
MKTPKNPFSGLTTQDLMKAYGHRPGGTPGILSTAVESSFKRALRALQTNGDISDIRKAVRAGKPVTVMTIGQDERFFIAEEREKIGLGLAAWNENLLALLKGKDIRNLAKTDMDVLEPFFGNSNIPLSLNVLGSIFAAATIIDVSGVAEPKAHEMFRRLSDVERETIKRTIIHIKGHTKARTNLNRYLKRREKRPGLI